MRITHNQHLSSRLSAVFAALDAGYSAGLEMSSASKGAERELFVSTFLDEVFPPHYRFGTGDVTDSYNLKSGQVDIVLEHAHGFSFPVINNGPRMFLAESVAAVIEVKSDISNQWNEVLSTTSKIKALNRKFASDHLTQIIASIESGTMDFPNDAGQLDQLKRAQQNTEGQGEPKIPVYAVGFKGWKTLETLKDKVADSDVDGVFIISERLFVGSRSSAIGLNSMLAFLHSLGEDRNKEGPLFPPTVSYSV